MKKYAYQAVVQFEFEVRNDQEAEDYMEDMQDELNDLVSFYQGRFVKVECIDVP